MQTWLSGDYKDATLQIALELHLEITSTIGIKVRDHDSSIIGETQVLVSARSPSLHLKLSVLDPRKWTAETPYLYGLDIKLIAQNSKPQVIHHKLGFRQVELLNGNIAVNGKAILFRGVNHHDFHPSTGRAVPLEFLDTISF